MTKSNNPCRQGLEYVNFISLQRDKVLLKRSVLGITLTCLWWMRLQFWNSGYGVPLHCHYSKVHSDPGTRHAGHCWRSRDELIRDVLLWIPTHGRAKAGRPARTYIQQLCEDTGCCPEDLPRATNDREEWRERVRDIRATSAIWWWW